ncbi:MAG: prepilin-type N-terminal cleavage/methylation domain-containing protein [Myxococcales bacterium]|nr:prepilin-type N-terminal cleavage/methylation domain-containing protein [Myxococcales bacterium]
MTSKIPHRRSRRRSRRGLSLVEVMVAIALMLALIAVLAPSVRAIFELDQRAVGRKLATLYERLHDEAVMRNLTFRIAFHLEQDRYVVESGEPGALISATPDEREAFEEETREKLRLMDEEMRVAWLRSRRQPFESLGKHGQMEFDLPAGVKLGGVYTPQYGRMVKPGDDVGGGADEDDPLKVFSHVMNNGFVEHTLIWITSAGDDDDGWTVEVEPLSGVVHLHGELVDVYDIKDDVPDDGPSLPN